MVVGNTNLASRSISQKKCLVSEEEGQLLTKNDFHGRIGPLGRIKSQVDGVVLIASLELLVILCI